MAPTRDSDFYARSRDELLDFVYRRGRRIRTRTLWVRTMSGSVAVMLLIGGQAALLGGDDGRTLVRAADDRGESGGSGERGIGQDPADSSAPEGGDDPSEPAAHSGAPEGEGSGTSTTTTASLGCRNSRDPACGEFYWDPEPQPNTPAEGRIVSIEPADPVAGQQVSIRVEIEDKEDLPDLECWSHLSYGDGPASSCDALIGCTDPPPHGAWDPPQPVPESRTKTFTHVYADPGTYKFEYRVGGQASCFPKWPWIDSVTVDTTITVGGPGTTTTTTTGPLPI